MVKSNFGNIPFEFANALAKGKYEQAHSLLSTEMQKEWTPSLLAKEVSEMIDYGSSEITHVEVIEEMSDWDDKETNDAGWAYVAMSGVDYSEGVTVVVCKQDIMLKIREIEWGRP